MPNLPFEARSGGRRRSPSPSLGAIAAIAVLSAGVAYLAIPAGLVSAATPEVEGSEHLAPTPHKSSDPAPASISGTASVIDGDTLEIHGERIRLEGVDAPEAHQQCKDAGGKFWRCGQVAANQLDNWIGDNPVSCTTHGREKWGRLLATCTVRGASVQEWLVSHGYALAYRSFSTAYVPAEEKAHAARAGVWAGEFVEPWDWRKGKRMAGEKPTKAMKEARLTDSGSAPSP